MSSAPGAAVLGDRSPCRRRTGPFADAGSAEGFVAAVSNTETSPDAWSDGDGAGSSPLLGGFKSEGGSGGGTAIAGAAAGAGWGARLAPIISFQRSRKA